MADLHPDKLIGVARALGSGLKPVRPRPGLGNAPSPAPVRPRPGLGNAPTGPALTPGARAERVEQAPSLLENMAYALRDRHWNNHLQRLFERPSVGAGQPAPSSEGQPVRAVPPNQGGGGGKTQKPVPFINLQVHHPPK